MDCLPSPPLEAPFDTSEVIAPTTRVFHGSAPVCAPVCMPVWEVATGPDAGPGRFEFGVVGPVVPDMPKGFKGGAFAKGFVVRVSRPHLRQLIVRNSRGGWFDAEGLQRVPRSVRVRVFTRPASRTVFHLPTSRHANG